MDEQSVEKTIMEMEVEYADDIDEASSYEEVTTIALPLNSSAILYDNIRNCYENFEYVEDVASEEVKIEMNLVTHVFLLSSLLQPRKPFIY
jgi:uncharacterized lipoprotein YehR (DUF1307 family)